MILVVGGGGYLGAKLVQRLLAEGHEVRVLDNLMFGPGPLEGMDIDLIRGDAMDPDTMRRTITGVDLVFAAAGFTGNTACELSPAETVKVNVTHIQTIVDVMSGTTGRLIVLSSAAVFGGSAGCDQTGPRPRSTYACSKLLADDYALARADQLPVSVLRLACVYGVSPRMRFDIGVNAMVAAAVQDGVVEVTDSEALRPYIHIEDALDAILMLTDPGAGVTGRAINVGCDDQCIPDRAAAAIVQSCLGCEVRVLPGSEEGGYAASFRELRELGFAPRRTIADGVLEIRDYLNEIPDHRQDLFHNEPVIRRWLDKG